MIGFCLSFDPTVLPTESKRWRMSYLDRSYDFLRVRVAELGPVGDVSFVDLWTVTDDGGIVCVCGWDGCDNLASDIASDLRGIDEAVGDDRDRMLNRAVCRIENPELYGPSLT